MRYPEKSKFNGATDVCTEVMGCLELCSFVQQQPDTRIEQPDGRICYDKDFRAVIGTDNGRSLRWGRLVIDPNGVVVTLFPESSAGCH